MEHLFRCLYAIHLSILLFSVSFILCSFTSTHRGVLFVPCSSDGRLPATALNSSDYSFLHQCLASSCYPRAFFFLQDTSYLDFSSHYLAFILPEPQGSSLSSQIISPCLSHDPILHFWSYWRLVGNRWCVLQPVAKLKFPCRPSRTHYLAPACVQHRARASPCLLISLYPRPFLWAVVPTFVPLLKMHFLCHQMVLIYHKAAYKF